MREKLNNFKRSLKPFVIGFILGAIVVGLYLDNRAGAILKALNAPIAVNGLEIKLEVKN